METIHILIIVSTTSFVALLSALWTHWTLCNRVFALEMDLDDMMQAMMMEMVRGEQLKQDVEEKVSDYGDLTEKILNNLKK